MSNFQEIAKTALRRAKQDYEKWIKTMATDKDYFLPGARGQGLHPVEISTDVTRALADFMELPYRVEFAADSLSTYLYFEKKDDDEPELKIRFSDHANPSSRTVDFNVQADKLHDDVDGGIHDLFLFLEKEVPRPLTSEHRETIKIIDNYLNGLFDNSQTKIEACREKMETGNNLEALEQELSYAEDDQEANSIRAKIVSAKKEFERCEKSLKTVCVIDPPVFNEQAVDRGTKRGV